LKGLVPQEELDHLKAELALDVIHPLTVPELEGERHLVVIKQA
jgi:16S rRNA (guanine527-N7)-methyltransferase